MGGLGNQLFQAANALSQAWSANVNPVFKPNSYTPLSGNNTSKYVSNIFKRLEFADNLNNHIRISEKSWEYSKLSVSWESSVEFYGYFQSSKNFLTHKKEIQNIFSPDNDFLNFAYIKYPKLKLPNTLSIHVRIGDYKKFPETHPVVSSSYINKAISLVKDIDHIFLFSDDKTFKLSNFDETKITYVNEEDYAELWLMSLCKNNIMSNSTFSWWGAFLNKNINKKIIAPSIWFGPSGPSNYMDIFEPYWEIINVEYKNGELIYVT